MHAYRRFVEDQMDERHWTRADLARHSGLSKQTISNIVNDKRDKLGSPPDDKTVDGLARAFSMSRDKVLAHVALAMGLPVSIERADVREVSDADLLLEVRRRMEARHDHEGEEEPGQEAGSTINRGTSSSEDGGEARWPGAPIGAEDTDTPSPTALSDAQDVQRVTRKGQDDLAARRWQVEETQRRADNTSVEEIQHMAADKEKKD